MVCNVNLFIVSQQLVWNGKVYCIFIDIYCIVLAIFILQIFVGDQRLVWNGEREREGEKEYINCTYIFMVFKFLSRLIRLYKYTQCVYTYTAMRFYFASQQKQEDKFLNYTKLGYVAYCIKRYKRQLQERFLLI